MSLFSTSRQPAAVESPVTPDGGLPPAERPTRRAPAWRKGRWAGGCLAIATLLLLALPYPLAGEPFSAVSFGALTVVLAAVLLVLGRFLVHRVGQGASVVAPVQRWEWALYAGAPLVMWGLWLLAFFPGVMTNDSSDQWSQALSGEFLDHHPAFHTLAIRLLQKVWLSPASVAAAQILALGALVGWACVKLRRGGLPRWAAGAIALLMALAPVNGTFINTLWKDIPFSISVFALTLLVFWVAVARQEQPLARPRFWAGWVVAAMATLLFRHNGPPAVLGGFAALLLLERTQWKRILVAAVATWALTFGVRQAVWRTYDVRPGVGAVSLVGLLGAHVAHGTPLTDEERTILNALHPLEDRWNYHCITQSPTLYGGRFSSAALSKHQHELARLLVNLSLRDVRPVISHIVCASSMLWKVDQAQDFMSGPAIWWEDGRLRYMTERPGGPQPHSLLPSLQQRLWSLTEPTLERGLTWFFWRPATALYLLLLACLVVCLRQRSWRHAAVLAPIVLHTAALIVFNPSPDVRYQYPVILVSLLLTPCWLLLPRLASSPGTEA